MYDEYSTIISCLFDHEVLWQYIPLLAASQPSFSCFFGDYPLLIIIIVELPSTISYSLRSTLDMKLSSWTSLIRTKLIIIDLHLFSNLCIFWIHLFILADSFLVMSIIMQWNRVHWYNIMDLSCSWALAFPLMRIVHSSYLFHQLGCLLHQNLPD